MPQWPVTSIPPNIDTLNESLECASHIVDRMLATSPASNAQNKTALTEDFKIKVHQLVTTDHFSPYYERVKFFIHMNTEVFGNNMLDTVNALQTGQTDVVWDHILQKYNMYMLERSAHWILQAACQQNYNKEQIEQMMPLDVSNLARYNWQQLLDMAIMKDNIDMLVFLSGQTTELNFSNGLSAALHHKAHACLDYIVPRVPLKYEGFSLWLTYSGYAKNQKVFEYFCSKVGPDHHTFVRAQLEIQTASNANLLAWFDEVTARQQRERLLNEVGSPKHSVIPVIRKM